MEQIISEAWNIRKLNFPDEVEFDFPSKTKVISVTGIECSLKCAHCNGHYLKSMLDIENWQAKLEPETKSCLISGGCDLRGKVPLLRYLSLIKEIRNSHRRTNLHVGLVDNEEIEKITEVADVISFDFVGDNETIKEVYGLDKTVDDYVQTYLKLKERVAAVPHICIGLRGGQISGEYEALSILKKLGVLGLVFIVFSPTTGTQYSDRQPPQLEEVVRVLCAARREFPDIPIHLGCMRPQGKYRAELDQLAIRCGVNKVVQPTPASIKLARGLGLEVKIGEECCAL